MNTNNQRPILTNLPGFAGGEWPDATLLLFLTKTISESQEELRQWVSQHLAPEQLIKLREILQIATQLSGASSDVLSGMVNILPKMKGLAGYHVLPMREALLHICFFLFDNRVPLLRHFITDCQKCGRAALCWAQSLVVAEQILAREGIATDYDAEKEGSPVRPTRLERIAFRVMVAIARWGLDSEIRFAIARQEMASEYYLSFTREEQSELVHTLSSYGAPKVKKGKARR